MRAGIAVGRRISVSIILASAECQSRVESVTCEAKIKLNPTNNRQRHLFQTNKNNSISLHTNHNRNNIYRGRSRGEGINTERQYLLRSSFYNQRIGLIVTFARIEYDTVILVGTFYFVLCLHCCCVIILLLLLLYYQYNRGDIRRNRRRRTIKRSVILAARNRKKW